MAMGWLAAVGFTGCVPPDTPTGLALELPTAALTWLEPDSVASEVLHPGVVYRYLWSPRGPWAVHLVQAALSERCDLEFGVLQAEAREGGGSGRERVSSMVARSDERVLAAVNADFFTPAGTTVGAEVVDGRVHAAEARPTFAWRPGQAPWMGIAEVTAEEVRVGWSVDRDRGDDGTEAVGGFPDLIDEGARVGDLEVSARPSFAAARHPRTAVGYDPTTGTTWLVVVDGRQAPYSAGMTLPELAALLEALGAQEAINLDGGGSTALVLGPPTGRTSSGGTAARSPLDAGGRPIAVNRPSDITGERPVVNGLALIQHARGCAGRTP